MIMIMMMVTMREQVQSKYGWDQRHPRFAWGGGGSDCHQWPMLFLKKYQSNQDDDDDHDDGGGPLVVMMMMMVIIVKPPG